MNADSYELELDGAEALISTDAGKALERALSLAEQRSDPRAFRLAADAYRARGQEDDAVAAEISAIRCGLTPLLKKAIAALEAGRGAEARGLALQHLRLQPRDLLARTIAAESAMSLRHYVDAETMLREVVERAPTFPRASLLLARCLAEQLRIADAMAVLEKLLTASPEDRTALLYLADLQAQAGNYATACGLYEKVIPTQPDDTATLLRYAHNLRAAGRKAESVSTLRQVLNLSTGMGSAWWALAYYSPEELGDAELGRLRSALAGPALSSSDAGLMQVALSILYDRRGEYEVAFRLVEAFKHSRASEHRYDPHVISAEVDRLICEFTPELYAARAADGSADASPIFIVGMPRSGSTLTERILGRHSQIEAAGELQVFPQLAEALEQHRRAAGSATERAPLPEDLKPLADWYLERAREFRHSGKSHFIDKYNANWLNAGLIRLIFPNARIIDIRRNALDCCWSIYKTLGDPYASDQRNLARYYRDYVRFMAAIDAAAPGGILTVRYEELVDDIESQTRRILEFLGLEFEPACLDFHLSSEPVATPSSEQVRQPVNRQGIGAAHPYRRWLGALIDELGDLAR